MDEKTYQAILNGEITTPDISHLDDEQKNLIWDFYEYLLRKQQERELKE